MKNFWLLIIVLLAFAGCKSKRTTLTDDQVVTSEEFIEFFPELSIPFNVADSTLSAKRNDSAIIGNKVLSLIIGDSVLKRQFGTGSPRVYPIGSIAVKKSHTFVFIKAIGPAKKAVYALAFDKQNNFKSALPILVQDTDPQTAQSVSMDRKYTILMTRQRKKSDGTALFRREAYVYNDGVYTLILTESNEDLAKADTVVNPLDTLVRKHKYSGDYTRDKRNIVSVRDGKNPTQMRFFIHFEKDKGTCRGELRGEARFVKHNIAVYRESGDPCVLQFTFTANSVSMQEVEGCGNYRDIKCFFEGSFPKKKEAKLRKK